MFNKTFIIEGSKTDYVPYEKTVTVNRAPTDESIRLLNEFEEKARLNIINKISIDNNVFKGKAVMYKNSVDNNITIDSIFYLNGKEYRYKTTVNRIDFMDSIYDCVCIKNMVTAMSNEISREILKNLITSKPICNFSYKEVVV